MDILPAKDPVDYTSGKRYRNSQFKEEEPEAPKNPEPETIILDFVDSIKDPELKQRILGYIQNAAESEVQQS